MPQPISQLWVALCRRRDRADRAPALWTMLEALYAYPVRRYHTLDHARQCVEALHLCAPGAAARPDECELALWVHDCVYVPGAADNERRSAEIGAVFCRELRLDEPAALRVQALVLATLHESRPLVGDAALVADIDLSSIGAPPEAFRRGSELIRQEFAAIPSEVYRLGRIAFLRSMLARERLFHTDEFHGRLDGQARVNLRSELATHGGE